MSKPMSASQDPDNPISHFIPPPKNRAPLSPAKMLRNLDELRGQMGVAMANAPVGFVMKLQRWIRMVDAARSGVQTELPGMPESVENKSRGTMAQVSSFCQSNGLSFRDAEWFFFKCEGCGWKNGGKPIVCWRSTVRSWKAGKFFPSQKQVQAAGGPNEIDRLVKTAQVQLNRNEPI